MCTRDGGEGVNVMLPVAVVDDDRTVREFLRDVLIEEGYVPHLFDGADGTYQGIRALSLAAVILDIRLGKPDAGWALLHNISTDPALERTALIICSGDVTGLDAHPLSRPYAVLPKPFDLDELALLLQELIPADVRERTPVPLVDGAP